MKYCSKCVIPETAETHLFDENNVCSVCNQIDKKKKINWSKRKEILKTILDKYSADNNDYYDCMVPISGGKDSTFQLYVLSQLYNKRI